MAEISHPSVIAVGEGGGLIALSPCPGLRWPDGRVVLDIETLTADLALVQRFGATAFVTLMEEPELRGFGLAAEVLRDRVEALGFEWHHLPIADFGTPGAAFEEAWRSSGPRLRRTLREGQRVVLHCLGGRGRSGTVAARLLVELGVEPDEAIRMVRAARPGAIESEAQAAHVRLCRPVVEVETSPPPDGPLHQP